MAAEPRSTIDRALLRLYPRSFRGEYRTEMLADFARKWRVAASVYSV